MPYSVSSSCLTQTDRQPTLSHDLTGPQPTLSRGLSGPQLTLGHDLSSPQLTLSHGLSAQFVAGSVPGPQLTRTHPTKLHK
jgi:hypothetical protein